MKNIHGGDIYQYESILDFSANINPFGTPERVKEAIIQSVDSVKHYPDITCLALREKIAEAEGVSTESVICGNGAADLIYRLIMVRKPKKAMVLAPGFAEYEQALQFVGTKIQYYYLNQKTFRLDDSFLNELTEELDMLCICSPNNPTGQVIEPELLEEIRKRCQANEIFLLMDECFNDFLDNPEEHSLVKKVKQDSNIFILKAFTKMYVMAGVRLGYGICGNHKVLDKMYEAGPPWNVSTIAQCAGIAALMETEVPKKTREYVKKEKQYFYHELEKHGIKYWKTDANYIFFQAAEGLKEAMIEQGILIRDCSNYKGLEKGYYRIAVKTHEENEKLIQALRYIYTLGGNTNGKINYDSGNYVQCREEFIGRRTLQDF